MKIPGIHDIIDRSQREYFKWQYLRATQAVFKTSPLQPGSLPFSVLSMVHKRDVISYLIAVKSFSKQANPSRIIVVCDPTIDESDRAHLKEHIPHIELREADEFTHANIPRGGTWERLFAISEYVRQSYVVQLDADTLTIGDIKEVKKSIQENRAFVLGEEPNQRILTLEEASIPAKVRLLSNSHIQTQTEAVLSGLPLPDGAKYLRGCSGFCGYPRENDFQLSLLTFSRTLTGHFGDLWKSWGTEQITSNYLLANMTGTKILPFPQYGTPDATNSASSFIHFIGSMRFISDKYLKESMKIIKQLDSF